MIQKLLTMLITISIKAVKILVTPHVAFATNEAGTNGRETVIKNIEAYIKGTPQNLIIKR